MKVKHFVVVSLLLAILTLGAVSAAEDVLSDDILAVEDEGISIEGAPAEEQLSSNEDVVGAVADDFKANITDEIDLDDEDAQIAEVYCPEGATGNVRLDLTSVNDEEDSDSDLKYLSDYAVGDKITFSTGEFDVSPGKYNARLTYVEGDNTILLKESVIKFTGTITKDDFRISKQGLIRYLDDDYVVNVWDYPTTGTLIVYVDGEKRYSKTVVETDDICVDPNELGITDEDEYAIRVVFNTTDGQKIELASFPLTVEFFKGYWFDIVNQSMYYDDYFDNYYLAYFVSTNKSVGGLLKFYVNNVEKFSHKIVPSDYTYDDEGEVMYGAYPGLAEMGTTKPGTYDIRISFNGIDLASSKATLGIMPVVHYPHIMSVGEKQYLTVSYSGGKGTAELYECDSEGDYDGKAPMATFSITNGKGSFSLSKLPEGDQLYYLNYTIDGENFNSYVGINVYENSAEVKARVTPTQITAGDRVSVTVTGPKVNEMVDIYLDGDKVMSVSLRNGKVNEVLSGLTVGTHVVRVMFDGSDFFFSKTYKVTVKPKTVKLSLKKVTVKRSAKKLVLQATLKIKGKVAKGKIIKFKFNKKTYKAKTNRKGVAKVTVKRAMLKKLKRGKKVTYSATYGKTTKKITVKVRR